VPLVKPPLATVQPGHPVTAQGWNAIVSALDALYDAVLAIGSGSVTVSVQADGQPVAGAQVVAEPAGEGQPVDGLPLFGTRTTYLVAGVSDGAWRIYVSAAGYVPQVIDVNVPASAPVVVNLARAGKVVPDLFGQPLQGALATLSGAGLDVDIILDALGQEVSRTQVPAEAQNSPVLLHFPAAGEVVDPATTRLQIVVAAALREEPIVTVPSLVGLTQAEASRALEKVGLRLGKITVRS
jgi:hypothetical protein